ncbi:MAG: hypothetical protein ACR2QF_04875 [Geminicoccaceae bacterium]
MTAPLPNGLILQGLCVQCASECSIRLVDEEIPEEGDIFYQAECARHGEIDGHGHLLRSAEELEPLPDDAAKAVRLKTTRRRRQTVCCFEGG